MTNKEIALSAINARIKDEQKNWNVYEEAMKKDFIQFFVQNADGAYKSKRLISELTKTAEFMDKLAEKDIPNEISNERDLHLKFLVNGRLTSNSTNYMYNIAYAYEMDIHQQLYRLYSMLYLRMNTNKEIR